VPTSIFFTSPQKLNRDTRDRPHRKCSTATRIAVDFGEDDAAQRDPLVEFFGDTDGFLADHGVDDQQPFVGLGDGDNIC